VILPSVQHIQLIALAHQNAIGLILDGTTAVIAENTLLKPQTQPILAFHTLTKLVQTMEQLLT
jgi:hypothetical protein